MRRGMFDEQPKGLMIAGCVLVAATGVVRAGWYINDPTPTRSIGGAVIAVTAIAIAVYKSFQD